MLFAILKNEFDDGYLNWEAAVEKYGMKSITIDFTSCEWFELIQAHNFDCFLCCPPGREAHYKQLYDERIYILDKVLGYFVYPNFDEVSLHENKKFLSYWLLANKVPHPSTKLFYSKNEAIQFLYSTTLPVVSKFNIGASGHGVVIHRNRKDAIDYAVKMINQGGRQNNWGPNLKMGSWGKRILNVIKNPSIVTNRFRRYIKAFNEVQKGFVLFQEYVAHDYEWRVVRIGDSYFGHQKVKQGDKASGTKGINYVHPPDILLSFVKNICEQYNFNCMAIDLFEDGKGGYLVNELQCIFGHVQEYICEKDGVPGRFRFVNEGWIFEEGYYNSNLSYDLRFENVIQILSNEHN